MQNFIGRILLTLGLITLVGTSFPNIERENLADAGPVRVSTDKQEASGWLPYAGGILLVSGVIVLAANRRTALSLAFGIHRAHHSYRHQQTPRHGEKLAQFEGKGRPVESSGADPKPYVSLTARHSPSQ